LQIQEVHLGPHSNAAILGRFYQFFHTCLIYARTLQIQEVHLGPHSNAAILGRFY
jgi:hypothetical protein